MTLLMSLLPLYLLGNLHCVGMCGPLAFMLGRHRYWYGYFFGRILSFTLAGILAAALGQVLTATLQRYQIAAVVSLLCGLAFIIFGVAKLGGQPLPSWHIPTPKLPWLRPLQNQLATLMSLDAAWATFLFGFLTVMLPCGQSLFVFSACALSADVVVGFINGFAFALLTTPSLYLAMRTHTTMIRWRYHYDTLLALAALIAGSLAFCRGLADLDVISHLVLSQHYHLVLF